MSSSVNQGSCHTSLEQWAKWQLQFVTPNTLGTATVSAVICGIITAADNSASVAQVFTWGVGVPTGSVFALSELVSLVGGCIGQAKPLNTWECTANCCSAAINCLDDD